MDQFSVQKRRNIFIKKYSKGITKVTLTQELSSEGFDAHLVALFGGLLGQEVFEGLMEPRHVLELFFGVHKSLA